METKNIADYIKVDTINLNLESKNKSAIIKELYNNLKKTNLIKDEELGLNDIFALEEKLRCHMLRQKLLMNW